MLEVGELEQLPDASRADLTALAVRDLLDQDGPLADYRAVSRVTFTDPEVGSAASSVHSRLTSS